MSRLDSAILRLKAQRVCLADAKAAIADLDGPILELGLGNGRTYDHLREIFPDRDIFVFDRQVAPHPDCVPPEDRCFVGEITDTLTMVADRLGRQAALAHVDIGAGDPEQTKRNMAGVIKLLVPLLRPGALVVSDRLIAHPSLEEYPLPESVAPERYFMCRHP
jgi:hypothetical protein